MLRRKGLPSNLKKPIMESIPDEGDSTDLYADLADERLFGAIDFVKHRIEKPNKEEPSGGSYGQNVWGDAKAPAQVEGLGIGEDMESGDTVTGRRKRRGTKSSAGLGI